MNGFKNDGIQVAEYVYDVAVDGGTQTAKSLSSKSGYSTLPIGAIVKEVTLKVVTAFVGANATLIVGNTTDDNGYHTAAVLTVSALADNYIANGGVGKGALLWDDSNDNQLYFNVAAANDANIIVTPGTADFTAGKAIILVEYYLPSLS